MSSSSSAPIGPKGHFEPISVASFAISPASSKIDLLQEIALDRVLALVQDVFDQKQRQRDPKVYSLHAPEMECIGKGQGAPALRVRSVSVATTLAHAKGGQFVAHVKSLPGNPYDGHTPKSVIPDTEATIGNTIERVLLHIGYRGHNASPDCKFGCASQARSGG
jgi:transposase, IS5 family